MGIVKEALCWLMGLLYVGAGVGHFLNPLFFHEIMPPHVPWKMPLVYVSGVAEIVLGVAVIVRPTRRWAAWGIIALLVAVFPANIHMAVHRVQPQHAPAMMQGASPMMLWLRLPMQGVLALWAWWYTRPTTTTR